RPQPPAENATAVSSKDAEGEVIKISASAPTIDPTSTSQGITISKDYIRNIPVPGRTFESVLGAAAGAQGDAFSGGTSIDNKYIVEHGEPMSLNDAEPAWIVDHMTQAA